MSQIHKDNDKKFTKESPMDNIRRKFLAKIAEKAKADAKIIKEAEAKAAKEPTK